MNVFPRAVIAAACLGATSMVLAEMPTIDWDLDDAIRQIDGQADNFESAMAHVDFSQTDAGGEEIYSHSGIGFINEDGVIRYN